jgi:hypothetical protein
MKKIAALIVLCLPILAKAEMPNFDVKAYCSHLASLGGGPSQMLMQGCYANEQSSYDHIKPIWDTLPPDMKRQCLRLANYSPSYAMLEGCIDNEKSAQQSNGDFTFKR